MVRLSVPLCTAASIISAYCAGCFAAPHNGLPALEWSGQRGSAAAAFSSLLFPGTKMFRRMPEDSGPPFPPPFQATPGLTGGPVLSVDTDFAVCATDSGMCQPVLGSSWNQDIAAHLLSGVWDACGNKDNLTGDDLSRSSSRLHHKALEMARDKGGMGHAFPDAEDIFNPFERAFCFVNTALEGREWAPGTGAVCIDIIRFAFRSEIDRKALSENAVVISVMPPGMKFQNKDGSIQIATFKERLEAVAELGAKLIESVYYYNTEIASHLTSLPFVEIIRVSPLPLLGDEFPSFEREKGEEEGDEAASASFFDMPDDASIDESLAFSRALLRGMSRSYIQLRKLFLKKCAEERKRNGEKTTSRQAPGGAHIYAAKEGSRGHLVMLAEKKVRCMHFPLPVIDLAYDAVTSLAAALKAEEEALVPGL